MKRLAIVALASGLVFGPVGPANSNEFEGPLRDLANSQIVNLVNDPAIIAAIQGQNSRTAGLSEDEIVAEDKKWRAEVGASDQPTIGPVLENDVSNMLRAMRDDSGGLFTEIFVMDQVGLNVAASDTTSDYWQGDEAKWQETYPKGSGAMHISDVELDDSTQSYQAQISVAITDPDSNQVVGAATFGVNIEFLE